VKREVAAVEFETLTVAELRDGLDAQTRQKLGLSVDEFLERCSAQTLDMSSPAISRLAALARLLLAARAQ
jgi:hypothetical protein